MTLLSDFLTVQEAASFLGVSPNTVRNWGRDDKITEYRHPVNNYRLYRQKDLELLLKPLRPKASHKARVAGGGKKRQRPAASK